MTGWVGFRHDLTRHQDTLAAMNATMACRGPDDEGSWTSPHAALAHRRLSIIDLDGGHQPMVAGTGTLGTDNPAAVLVYTGEIYNFRELRAELRGRGHRFRTESDTEVVLRSYLEWGERCAERFNGMYAFAIWDVREEELLLVRDRMGVKPLYYYPTEDGVLFGSEPKAILAHPQAPAVVDADGLREIFSVVQTPGHAVFRGMHQVRPGTMVRVSRRGLRETRYWRLVAREHTDDLATTIGTVRELLEDIIERQLFADVPVGTLLSGGLDSSAVTALAMQKLTEQGAPDPLRAFSVDFSGHGSRFRPNIQWEDPDTPFAVEVAAFTGAEHVTVLLDNADLLDTEVRRAVLRAQDLPISTGDMEYSLYLLCKELRKQVKVALSGEAADELFGGYTWFHEPDAVKTACFPWHSPFRGGGGIDTLRLIGLWDRLDLTGYVEQRYAEALAEVPRLDGETGHEARMRELGYLNLTRWETFLLDRKDRMSMAAGLEVRVPFCDHRLVEYVFNTPWSMKNFDGREKSLLRAAVRDLLPKSVLDRKKSPYPSTQDTRYERELRRRLEGIITADAPVLQLVPEADLRKLLAVPEGGYRVGGLWTARSIPERLLEFNAWVTEYGVRVEL
ncbi:asparagine synthase (glutamine-hydrolyzing) [Amycolatopsis nigrescens]|uniref:asparagine synthase (glutamine-hydrolyzing) n=1 Tax=Amycolatopsis nigrescens TaxID=381445 RepID=UPI00035CD47D|nr:asparagine synthase (glutamine-hydrolyzing) [Amycolatopsis nigrescens]